MSENRFNFYRFVARSLIALGLILFYQFVINISNNGIQPLSVYLFLFSSLVLVVSGSLYLFVKSPYYWPKNASAITSFELLIISFYLAQGPQTFSGDIWVPLAAVSSVSTVIFSILALKNKSVLALSTLSLLGGLLLSLVLYLGMAGCC